MEVSGKMIKLTGVSPSHFFWGTGGYPKKNLDWWTTTYIVNLSRSLLITYLLDIQKLSKNSSNSSHSYMFSLLDIQNMGLRMGWFTNDLTRLGAKDVQMPDEKPWFRGNFFWGMGDGIAMLNLMY